MMNEREDTKSLGNAATSRAALQCRLNKWFEHARKIVIVGIGNTLRRDDAVGIRVVDNMFGRVDETVELIRAETVPESFTATIRRATPSHVLLVDAGEFGGMPGEGRLVKAHEADDFSISTHNLPLKVLAAFLEETTDAKVALLAVQPKIVEFGQGMTPELVEATHQISRVLIQSLTQR